MDSESLEGEGQVEEQSPSDGGGTLNSLNHMKNIAICLFCPCLEFFTFGGANTIFTNISTLYIFCLIFKYISIKQLVVNVSMVTSGETVNAQRFFYGCVVVKDFRD